MTAAPSPQTPASPPSPACPLGRLGKRLDEANAAARPLLERGLLALTRGAPDAAEAAARDATLAGGGALAWRLAALAREAAGDPAAAMAAAQTAYGLAPGDLDGVRDLSRLARQLGQTREAAELLAHVRAGQPGDLGDTREMAALLRDLDRLAEALALIRAAVAAAPDDPSLWTLLGAIAAQAGDTGQALIFHGEALRLAPGWAPALANRAVGRLERGDVAGARADADAALDARPPLSAAQAAGVRLTRAQARLRLGDLVGGWADYAARLDPARAEALAFDLPVPAWTRQRPLRGLRLLLVGEQGLGDEVMFAGLVPDVLDALGPGGALTLAVEPRLTPLVARSFPGVRVVAHQTVQLAGRQRRTVPAFSAGDIDAWAPLGAVAPLLRRSLDRFRARAYLHPDPQRVDHWRAVLAGLGPGPKVGIIWRSRLMTGLRAHRFAPFEAWAPVLATPGAGFVSLQYGEAEAELAWAARALGVEIVAPPGLDLMHDLDDLTALSQALDLVIGAPTATTNLAAACGAETWMICADPAWTTLGTDHYPWYKNAPAFAPRDGETWRGRLDRVAAALAERLLPT